MQRPPPAATDEEPEELKRFRDAWRAEVQRKKAQTVQSHRTSGSHDGTSHALSDLADDRPSENAGSAKGKRRDSLSTAGSTSPEPRASAAVRYATVSPEPGPSSEVIAGQTRVTSDLAPLGRALQSAVDVYRRAIQNEQSGDLDEALRLYRQAFRMDDNVDKAYRKAEKLQELRQNSQGAVPPATETRPDAPEPSIVVIDDKALDLSALSISADTNGAHGVHAVVTGTIAGLLESFPKELRFEPEDERRKLHLNKVPDELLIHILRYLDHTTIERFAAVDKKARVVSLDSVIWRDFVYETYKPPQVPHEKYMKAMMQRYLHDYRRAFIEQPRLRLDGVYIAVCHYVRAGLSQNAWVNVSHLITYHRFLRFFPNGQVISLLANEEVEPQQVIPLLKPTLRMKGVTVGNWRLEGTTVYITDLIDPASLELNASARSKRYAFQMTLALRSRPLGRWNKLDIAAYETVNIETGETDLLPLKHERPFWFSKVRSYASY